MLIAALVGVTYAFVTNVPQSPATTSTTLGATVSTTTTTTTSTPGDTTTTTLDPRVETFIADSDGLGDEAGTLSAEAASINAAFESDEAEYGPTRDALRDLASRTRQFATAVGIITLPTAAEDSWVEVTAAADLMAQAADDMLDGLVNSPGPEKRQASLITYQDAADDLARAIIAAQSAATGG